MAVIAHVRSGWRGWAANGAIALASIVVGLAVLEAATRRIDGMPVFSARNWLAERNTLLTTHTTMEYDSLLGWVSKPNQRVTADDPNASFTTGPFGIRLNAPAASPPAKGAILAVGDSFTAGSDVGDGQTWPAHLETLTQHPVVNGGVGGFGTDQTVLRAESLLTNLEPKSVVVSFFEGDILRTGLRVFGGASKPYFTVENDKLLHHNRPVPAHVALPKEISPWLRLLGHSYLVVWTTDRLHWSYWWAASLSYIKVGNDPVDISCRLLRRLRDETRLRDTRLLLVLQYSGQLHAREADKPADMAKVLGCARQGGIETLDLWDDLVMVRRRSRDDYAALWVSLDGCVLGHMSSAGNRFVAERIAARLSRQANR